MFTILTDNIEHAGTNCWVNLRIITHIQRRLQYGIKLVNYKIMEHAILLGVNCLQCDSALATHLTPPR